MPAPIRTTPDSTPPDGGGPGAADPQDLENLMGADPDIAAEHDGYLMVGDFPPVLHLDAPPEPTDGYPWADPATLADPDSLGGDPTALDGDPAALAGGEAPVEDLLSYAGLDPAGDTLDPSVVGRVVVGRGRSRLG